MSRTFISNDCLAYFMYKKIREEYESPFIGSLFENDAQYLKFCQNFDRYIAMEPVFAKPLMPVTYMDYKEIPIMFLGDIEIHWPHESNGEAFLLEKYKRRLERLHDPLFIWSDMQMYNKHHVEGRDVLREEFRRIPNSIFVAKDDIEAHKDKSLDSRNKDDYFSVPAWLDYNAMANHVLGRDHGHVDFTDKDI